MKITMSEVEAKELISCYFFNKGIMNVVPNDIDINTLPSPVPDLFIKPTLDLMGMMGAMRNFTHRADKIAAIKAVRLHCIDADIQVGLADTKMFVEQFAPWN